MDASIINPFLDATLNLLKNMFEVEAVAGKPFLLSEQDGHRWDISGIIGLVGAAQGVVVIRFARMTADKLLHKSGVETKTESERSEMVAGMVGELTNIISGNATSSFTEINIDISPPVVVQGPNHQISWPKIAPVMGIPFTSPLGPFEVDVCFRK